MIGDGVTDLETSNYVDFFIGYGGICLREKVKLESKYFISNFNELIIS